MSDEMGIFDVIYHCRAMRRLKPDPVPEELLLKLVDAGNQAPSGGNRQPTRWIIVRDPVQRKALAELNRKAVRSYIGSDVTRPGSLPHQSEAKRERMLEAVLWQAEHMHEVPALVIACAELDAPAGAGTAQLAGGSVWPAVQNVLLAARALGLGAAPTTLGLADRDAAKQVLAHPDNVAPVCLIPVGYPLGNFGPVTRLPVQDTVHWDRW